MSKKQENTTTTNDDISTRAMLVDVDISVWYAQKFDKKVSRKVNEEMHAADDAGRYNKHLLGKDRTFLDVINACNAARSEHYAQTLPWHDKGYRLLPTANYFEYFERMRKANKNIEEKLAALLVIYDDLRKSSLARMGDMSDPNDLPPASVVKNKFGMRIAISPLPATGDLRVELPTEEKEKIKKSIGESAQESIRNAMNDAWSRLYEVVRKMQERLTDPKATFRDSLVGNVVGMCDLLTRLNVTQDEKLEKMRNKVLETVKHEPQTFRDDKALREQTAKKAEKILKDMSTMFEVPEAEGDGLSNESANAQVPSQAGAL